MKKAEWLALGLAGVAVLLIVRSAGGVTGGKVASGGKVAGYGNAGASYDAQVWRDRASLSAAQFNAKYGWSAGDWL